MNVINIYFGIAIHGVLALFTDDVDTYKKLNPKQYDRRRSRLYFGDSKAVSNESIICILYYRPFSFANFCFSTSYSL